MPALKQISRNREDIGSSVGRIKKTPPRVSRKAYARLEDAPTPSLMGLPRIPKTIPTELIYPVNTKATAKIALTMMDAGLLTEADVLDGNRHPVALIENCFKRWFEKVVAPLTIFDVSFTLTDSIENWDSGLEDETARNEMSLGDVETIGIGVRFGEWDKYFLKDKVEALEKKAPGLGRTALSQLQQVLYTSMFVVTPGFIEDAARHIYWGGCDDEDEYLADYGVDEDEAEAMKDEMVTAEEVKSLLPTFDSKKLDTKALRKLASSSDPDVALVASLLLRKDSDEGFTGIIHPDSVSCDGSTCTDPGVWLQWQKDDLTDRIADDWYNYVSEYSCCSVAGFWLSEITPEKLAESFNNLERYISRLVWAEHLLPLLGDTERG